MSKKKYLPIFILLLLCTVANGANFTILELQCKSQFKTVYKSQFEDMIKVLHVEVPIEDNQNALESKKANFKEVFEKLKNKNTTVSFCSKYYFMGNESTILHIALAIQEDNSSIIKLITSNEKFDVNLSNKNQDTPLLLACGLVRHFCGATADFFNINLKTLMECQRLDFHAKNEFGETPFYFACKNKNIDESNFKTIFEKTNLERINLRFQGYDCGKTVLHYLSKNEQRLFIIEKIKKMPNFDQSILSIKDKQQRTPYDIAKKYANMEALKLLEITKN